MRIPVQISAESAEPMYHQIEVQLRSLIWSGKLPEGTMLPSIREFAQELNCSVITIRRVYQDLENEGLLRTRQGTGTFVAPVSKEDRDKYRLNAVRTALRQAVEAAVRSRCSREETIRVFRECLDELMPEKELGAGSKEGPS
jgi:GntR family transcriptional regulator